jgi:hypothetical protein
MNVAEFVQESLTQIISGIVAAQKIDGGEAVGAEMYGAPNTPTGHLIQGGTSGIFTVVDFDISVVAESKAEGKGGLRVWGIGPAEAGAGLSSHRTTRRNDFPTCPSGLAGTGGIFGGISVRLPPQKRQKTESFRCNVISSLSAKQHWVRSGHIGYGLFWRHG